MAGSFFGVNLGPFLNFCGLRRPGEGTEFVSLPMFHCGSEGTYKVTLNVEGYDVQCVVDSCSSELLIAGVECDSCENVQGKLPQNIGRPLGVKSTVNFFSQTNEIEWCEGELALKGVQGTRRLKVNFGKIIMNKSHIVNGGVLPGRNVLGLHVSDRHRSVCSKKSQQPFITQMFSEKGFPNPSYTFEFDEKGAKGWLHIGKKAEVSNWVPLVRAEELGFLKRQAEWILRLRAVYVVGVNGQLLKELPSLQYARFDIGNTWLSMPPSVGKVEFTPGAKGLVLVFSSGVAWTIPLHQYTGPVELANKTGFGGLAHDASLDAAPSHGKYCIIGNELLKGMTVVCDLATSQIGLSGPNIKFVGV